MKVKKLAVAAMIGGLTFGAQAATFFSEDFGTNTLGPNLTDTYGNGNFDTSGGNVSFTGTNDAGRGGIGTIDSDYASVDFTSNLDIINADTVFIGLGAGSSSQGGFFNEPADGPTIFMRVGDGDVFLYDGTETQLLSADAAVLDPTVSGINSVRMINDSTNDSLEFLYSTDGGANFTSAGSVDYSGTTLGTGTSKVFVAGGNGPSTIDNFSVAATVIPESSSFGLLGLGCLLLLKRRRK